MDKNRRNKKYSNWNNQKNNSQQNNRNNRNDRNDRSERNEPEKKSFQFNHTLYEDEASRRERQKAIQEIKAREVICPKCNQPITDVASAMADKATGKPVHFECVLAEVEKNENIGPNEKIAYIGQGRFGLLYYENIRDQRHFTIKKIIDWEDKDKKSEWREEIGSLYSQVD